MSKLSQFMGGGGGGGFGGLETVVASEDMTAESNTSVGINTSNAEVSVRLPANPERGDRITFFDVAMSWGVNPATIILNGDAVQQYSGANDRFLLPSAGGLLSLVFSGEQGWFDVSQYDNSLYPTWYESVPGSNGYSVEQAEFLGGKQFIAEADFVSSDIYHVPADGFYIIAAAASGGMNSSSSKRESLHNATTIELNDLPFLSVGYSEQSLIRKSSRYSGISTSASRYKVVTATLDSIKMAAQGGYLKQTVSKPSHVKSWVFNQLDDGAFFGIEPFQRKGGMGFYDGTLNGNYRVNEASFWGDSSSSSLLVFLKAGDVLKVSVGAGSSHPELTGSRHWENSESGRTIIYRLR